MKNSALALGVGIVLAAVASTASTASATPAEDAPNSVVDLLTANLAPLNQSLTATAWEHEIPGFDNEGQYFWGVDEGDGPVLDVYEYRLATSDGSIVDLQPTRGEQLSEADQQEYYESLGYNDDNPYSFNWITPVCVDDTVSLTERPELVNLHEWSIIDSPGYPNFTQSEWAAARNAVMYDNDGAMWNNLANEYNWYLQSQTGSLDTLSDGDYRYDAYPTQAVYAEFTCADGYNLDYRNLLDVNGQLLTSRTIALDAVSIDVGGFVISPIDLDGRYVMVVGGARSMNVATWGIAKVGQPVTAAPAAGLATAGAQVTPYLAVGAIVILAGVGFLVWSRRRPKSDD
ncbi:MAG TPA: hypothetical protein VK139_00065 [Microbacteriaceae bacterium]|nr:hypothetical protein [Microbacteriaceae bacterium]